MSDDITTGTGATAARRTPRQGVGGSPVGSVLSIVLAVIAVVLGYIILRDLTDNSSASSGGGLDALPTVNSDAPADSFDVDAPSTEITTTTTTIPFVTDGATVVVANGNNQGGSAGRMSDALEAASFIVGNPTNGSSTVDASVVYYDPGVTAAKDVADSLARALGGIEVLPVTTPAPTVDGTMGDGRGLLLRGNDQVDRPLDTPSSAPTLGTPELDETPVVVEDE